MSNEWLIVVLTLVDILFILYAARVGVEWLVGTIVLNLILIDIFGSILIHVFGLTTNSGNVFYACVFLATHFILERHGKEIGLKTIRIGVVFGLFFVILSQIATHFTGTTESLSACNAIMAVFAFSLRVTLASILGYVFAQYINISVYEWLRGKTAGKHMWLRSLGAHAVGQLTDSLIFFSIAFIDLSGPLLLQAMFAGWLIKVIIGIAGIPLLYLVSRNKSHHG